MKPGSPGVRSVCVGAILTAGLTALACRARDRPAPAPPAPAPAAAAEPAIVLSPKIPRAVAIGADTSLPGLQADFDVFSWNSFIALNWPRRADGSPDPNGRPGQARDNPAVWEAWQDSSYTFLPADAPRSGGRAARSPRRAARSRRAARAC